VGILDRAQSFAVTRCLLLLFFARVTSLRRGRTGRTPCRTRSGRRGGEFEAAVELPAVFTLMSCWRSVTVMTFSVAWPCARSPRALRARGRRRSYCRDNTPSPNKEGRHGPAVSSRTHGHAARVLHAHAHVALPGSWHPGLYRVFLAWQRALRVRCSECSRDRWRTMSCSRLVRRRRVFLRGNGHN